MFNVYFWYTDADGVGLDHELVDVDAITVERARIEFIRMTAGDRAVAMSTTSIAAIRGEDTVGMFLVQRNPVISLVA